jgi:glutamate dehydrogenase (NAD(P)+)
MGGVLCNPAKLSTAEMERITRAYVARLLPLVGPFQDVLQPEPALSPQIASWIHSEYAARLNPIPGAGRDAGEPAVLACVVGKPEAGGGIANREQAVACGILALLRRIAEEKGKAPGELCVALHGGTGSSRDLALAVRRMGCKWIEVPAPDTGVAGQEAVLQSACDVLILGNDEFAAYAGDAARIVAPVIIEAADLSITPLADMVLAQKGTLVIPSLVANAGVVIAAHLEWDANLRQVSIGTEAVGSEIEARVLKAYDEVRKRASDQRQTLRAAAYDTALERVATVERLRVS